MKERELPKTTKEKETARQKGERRTEATVKG